MKNHSRKTILLVEDEILVAMGESVVIEKYGFEVITAHNGEQAIELAQTNPDIDLILMDIDLGRGPDGTQTAAKILEFRELPIVFLTGHAEKEIVEKVKEITRYGYVLKYSGEFVLVEAINMAFELFEAHQKAEAENRKLQASERKFRTMYQSSGAGMARINLDFKIEQANSTYCRMLGYTENELIGKSLSDITHPDILPENLEKQRRLGRGEIENYTMEKRFIHKDGRTVFGLLNANLVRDNEGNPEYFLGNVVDITEHKLTQKQISRNRRVLRALIDASDDAILLIKPDGEILECNQTVADRFGKERRSLIGTNTFNLVTPEVAENRRAWAEKVLKTGKSVQFEDVRYGRNIKNIINPVLNEQGEVESLAIFGIDITEQKQAELALQDREERLKQIIQQMPYPVEISIPDGTADMVNRAFLNMFGIPSADMVIGQYNIFNDDIIMNKLGLRREMERVFQGEMIPAFEIILPVENYGDAYGVTTEATHLVQEVTMFPVFNRSGDVWRVVTIWRDITEQKKAEEKIQSLLTEKELLLREIHHRVKNDMSAISSILQLHTAASVNPNTVQALKEAQDRVNILGNIYEKLYADRDFRNIQLKQFLNNLVTDIARSHAAPRVSITADIEAMAISAKQSFYMGIIINELVTNACKYAFPNKDSGKISVTVRRLDDKLEIVVSDNGVGFQFQSDKKQVGFGFTLINALVAQYRGSMEIDTTNGTLVKIWLNYLA